MKKFFMMIGLLFIPFSVNALLEGDFEVTCEDNVLSPGQSTTCEIKGVVVNGFLHGFNGNISLGDGLSYVSFNIPKNVSNENVFSGDTVDGNIMLYTDSDLTGNIKIGDFIVQAGDVNGVNVNVSISSASLLVTESAAESDYDLPINIDPFTIRIPSSDNSLTEIRVNGNVLEDFEPTKTAYTIELPSNVRDTVISVIGANGASVTGDTGNKQISYGENNFVINVKAENGSEKQYFVRVIRPEIRELTSLKINDENIELVSGTYRYVYKVENEVTSVNVVANAGNGISFSEDFGSRTVSDLKVGNNEIFVKTKDSNGEELVYTIVVDRFNEKGKDVAPKEPEEKKNPSGTVDNPKTGITGVSVVLLGGCAAAYYVARKKGFIKKI